MRKTHDNRRDEEMTDRGVYLPSEEAIRAECQRIQASWTSRELLKRAGANAVQHAGVTRLRTSPTVTAMLNRGGGLT